MQQNRSELLNQLKLDKSASATKKGIPAAVLVGAGLLLGFSSAWMWLKNTSQMPEATITATMTSSTSNSAESQVLENKPSAREKILDASGYVTARRIATVSAEVMGLLLSVDVEEGMQVSEGQVLAQIDDSVAQINLRLVQAQVDTQVARVQGLQVDLAEAEREWARLKRLGVVGDYASEAQLSRAESTVERIQANIRSMQADLSVASLQVERQHDLVSDHRIRAPFAGVVTTKNAQAGEIVAPSAAGGGFTRTGICTIVDMDSLEIQVDVNEAFIGRVKPDQPVNAILDAYPSWQIPAKVIAVIPTADRAKATVRVRIQILQKDIRILPDMGVKVSFLAEEG